VLRHEDPHERDDAVRTAGTGSKLMPAGCAFCRAGNVAGHRRRRRGSRAAVNQEMTGMVG